MGDPVGVSDTLSELMASIRSCRLCADDLPLGPRPVLRASTTARILIAAQAPGRRVHQTGLPFDDPSGDRLRGWLGMDRRTFYDDSRVAIVPMGFCYPGTGPTGDRPPRPECSRTWHPQLLPLLRSVELTLVIGQYAHAYHLGAARQANLTDTVRAWRDYGPAVVPMPHPSPRNIGWLRRNPWFEAEVVPVVRDRVRTLLTVRSAEPGEDREPTNTPRRADTD